MAPLPALPAAGDRDWYPWALALHTDVAGLGTRLNYRGEYASGTAYKANDVVAAGAYMAIARVEHTSVGPAPTANTTNWWVPGAAGAGVVWYAGAIYQIKQNVDGTWPLRPTTYPAGSVFDWVGKVAPPYGNGYAIDGVDRNTVIPASGTVATPPPSQTVKTVSATIASFDTVWGPFVTLGGSVSLVGGRARIPVVNGYVSIQTAADQALAGGTVLARLRPVTGAAAAAVSADVTLMVNSAAEDTRMSVTVRTKASTIVFANEVGYYDPGATTITYDATAHAYVRIREAAGQVYWETSPNGTTWTIRKQAATPAWAAAATSYVQLFTFGDVTGGYAEIDSVNVTEGTETVTPAPSAGMPVPTFRDEFTGTALSLATDQGGGTWRTRGGDDGGSVNNGYRDYAGSSWNISPAQHPNDNPFTVANSVLTITAKRASAAVKATANAAGTPVDWQGGYLVSNHLNNLMWSYGYFEFRARFRNPGRGQFPALWLYNNEVGRTDGKQRAEIDLFEIFGYASGRPWESSYHNRPTPNVQGSIGRFDEESTSWHRYGVAWTSTEIRLYRDGILRATLSGGPATWFQGTKLGIRINYAVDPSWEPAGSASRSTTTDPAVGHEFAMDVDYVRYWATIPSELSPGVSNDPMSA